MITLTKRNTDVAAAPDDMPTLTLTCQQRTHSRLRASLDDGRDVGVVLPRGTTIAPGDVLASDDGLRVRVTAATESLSRSRCNDTLLFARACYHLGNRHVPLQITQHCVAYSRDHVLDEMLIGLGLVIEHVEDAFEPESGAYGGGHHHAH